MLWKNRWFSVTVGTTLALCLGANVALFSVINNVVLRPLPFPDSERIVIVGNAYPKAGAANLRAVAVPDYFDHLRQTLKLRGTDEDIETAWNAIFLEEIPSTLKLVQDIRHRLPCFAFSNSNLTHCTAWRAKSEMWRTANNYR